MNVRSRDTNLLILRIVMVCYLAVVILFGGTSKPNVQSILVLQTIAPLVIIFVLWRRRTVLSTQRQTIIVGLFGATLLLGLLQLAPLPPEVWSALPNRGHVVEGFQLIGAAPPALPISLTPLETASGLFHFLPPLALFLLATQLFAEDRKIQILLPTVISTIGVASALIGLLQTVGANDSSLSFYTDTNDGSGVGIFSNANHHASFLLMCLPFLAATADRVMKWRFDTQARAALTVLLSGAALALVFGVLAAGSLFGYVALGPVALISLSLFRSDGPAWVSGSSVAQRLAFVGSGAFLVVAGYALGTSSMLEELGVVVAGQEGELARPQIFARTGQAISDTFPVGAGLGSFRSVYPLYEDPQTVTSTYVNHAHNDYLEVVLEFGVLGGVILFVGLAIWLDSFARLWGRAPGPGDRFRRAASIAVLVMIFHSFIDYPLRTTASAGLAAVAASLMTTPRRKTGEAAQSDIGEGALTL